MFQNQRKMSKIKVRLKAELTLCALAFPWQSRVPSPGRTAALLIPLLTHSLGMLWEPGPG